MEGGGGVWRHRRRQQVAASPTHPPARTRSLLLHARRRHKDPRAVLDADAPARARHPAEPVKGSAQLGDEISEVHGARRRGPVRLLAARSRDGHVVAAAAAAAAQAHGTGRSARHRADGSAGLLLGRPAE